MISLEQVQLLESRVAKAIEYVQRVTEENTALSDERAGLLSKLEANQKRLDELEMLVMRFKEDQGRIEDGIMAALDRLSQFEEAFESSLSGSGKTSTKKPTSIKKEKQTATASEIDMEMESSEKEEFFEIGKKSESSSKDSVKESEDNAGELDIF